MKRWIVLSMMLMLTAAIILTGCSTKTEVADKEANISEQVEEKAKEVEEHTKGVQSGTQKETMLPEDVPLILGKNFKELQKQKGLGEEEYMGEALTGLSYEEKWFDWDEKVKATYGIGDGPTKDQITSINFEFSKGTDDDRLIEQVSKYLGEGEKHEGGETNNYYIVWEQNDVLYYLTDYGYLVMSIYKEQ